jgi:hypothetical protein
MQLWILLQLFRSVNLQTVLKRISARIYARLQGGANAAKSRSAKGSVNINCVNMVMDCDSMDVGHALLMHRSMHQANRRDRRES